MRILAVVLGLLLAAAAPQEEGRKKRPEQGKGPDVGKKAPDFNLKKLVMKKSEEGKEKKPEYVKLSSFKDKRAVVLIFGSYT